MVTTSTPMMHRVADTSPRPTQGRGASPRAFGTLYGQAGFSVWAPHPLYDPRSRRLWLTGAILNASGVLAALGGIFGFYAGAPWWLCLALVLAALPLIIGSSHLTSKATNRLPEILRTAQLATPVLIASGAVTTIAGLIGWQLTTLTTAAWTGTAATAGPVTALLAPGLTAYLILTGLRRAVDGVGVAAIIAVLQIAVVHAVAVQVPSRNFVQWDMLERVGIMIGLAIAASSWLQQTRIQPSAAAVSYDLDGWRIRGVYRSRNQHRPRKARGSGGDVVRLSRDQLSGNLLVIMDRAMTDYARMQDTRYARIAQDQLVRIAAEVRAMMQAEEHYGDSTLVNGDELRRQVEELRQLSLTATQTGPTGAIG